MKWKHFPRYLALCLGESTGHRWIPLTKEVTRSCDAFFDLRLKNVCANIRDAGDLRRHRGHYGVTVMDNDMRLFYGKGILKAILKKKKQQRKALFGVRNML